MPAGLVDRKQVHRKQTTLVAGARQARHLRTTDGAVGHLQLCRPRACRGWLEHHDDLARGLGGQARGAGRRGDAEVSRRRDRDAGKSYGLLVG